MKGHPDTFQPYDLAIEHTVKEVKVIHRPKGPGTSWDLLKKRSPAIPTLRMVDTYMNKQFPTIYRGIRHSTPKKEQDVALLHSHFTLSKIHQIQGRKLAAENKAKDALTDGFLEGVRATIPGWVERLAIYSRAEDQTWWPPRAESSWKPADPLEDRLKRARAAATARTTEVAQADTRLETAMEAMTAQADVPQGAVLHATVCSVLGTNTPVLSTETLVQEIVRHAVVDRGTPVREMEMERQDMAVADGKEQSGSQEAGCAAATARARLMKEAVEVAPDVAEGTATDEGTELEIASY